MTHLLLLLSSARGPASLSTMVANVLASRLAEELDATLKTHDLAVEPPQHIASDYVFGRSIGREQRTALQAEAVDRAEMLLAELLEADVLVIAASMVNFAPSSTLKAWIDHVVWPGRTMTPTPQGPKGLISGKKVYLVTASGGAYSSGPAVAADFLVPYLKHMLGCIGLLDVQTISIEAQSFGPDAAQKSVADALAEVEVLANAARR